MRRIWNEKIIKINPFLTVGVAATAVLPMVGCNNSELLDYSNSSNWMIKEEYGTDTVDVFYLYPSVSGDTERDVAIVNDEFKQAAYTNTSGNIKCLDPITNIYAPYYHQLTAGGIGKCPTATDMYKKIKDNQYIKQDVFNALDYYFAHYNKGKPYILASHSQGSVVMQIVLEEYMPKHKDYYAKMVCAYTLGMNYTKEYADRNTHVKFATGADDTGVVMTWNSFGANGQPGYTIRKDENPVGYINPMNWKTNGDIADTNEHLGGYDATTGGCTPGFIKCHLDTDNHLLIMDNNKSWADEYQAKYPLLPGIGGFFGNESFHFEDWRLFAGNIRENAKVRIDAFQKKNNLH